jgi:hypothetical protein
LGDPCHPEVCRGVRPQARKPDVSADLDVTMEAVRRVPDFVDTS